MALLKIFKLKDNAVSRLSHGTMIHHYFAKVVAVVGPHAWWIRLKDKLHDSIKTPILSKTK